MASASAASKRFPLQLAIGVLKDLLSKELDAHLFPENKAKATAFVASRDSLPHRLALLMSQIAGSESASTIEGVCAVLTELWRLIFCHPSFARIQPSVLQSSLWLETLASVFKAACVALDQAKAQLLEGGALVTAALRGNDTTDAPFASLAAERVAQVLSLLEWWGDEVCTTLWGVKDAWGLSSTGTSPLHAIADYGLTALVPLAVAKGCPVNGDFNGASTSSPAGSALKAGHIDVVEALLAQGLDITRPYEEDGWPLGLRIFSCGDSKTPFFADFFRSRPELLTSTTSAKSPLRFDIAQAALISRDAEFLDLVLSAGVPIEYGCRLLEGNAVVHPLIASALSIGDRRMVELLIDKWRVLENWREKYDETALAEISERLAKLAVSAYPSNPIFTGDPERLLKDNRDAMACVVMVLASGFNYSWGHEGQNALLATMYVPGVRENMLPDCVSSEAHAFAILKRFHGAGFNVLNIGTPAAAGGTAAQLQYFAACTGQPSVIEWCVDTLGADPDPEDSALRILKAVILRKSFLSLSLILDKYKVRAAYHDRPLAEQPVMTLLCGLEHYTDAEALLILSALIKRDRSLFDLPCFGPTGAAGAACGDGFLWNPLFALAYYDRPRTLEFLLEQKLPAVEAMANKPEQTKQVPVTLTAAQQAAYGQKWECLGLLLRYTNARVTDSFHSALSVEWLVKRASRLPLGLPRALHIAVEARAKKELADKAKTAAASQAAGVATNAFEDPSIERLIAAEEKAKIKKKTAKKKAKAKKRAAAASASAGSADAATSRSDDDGSSSDGEANDADDNEDVRYAPDFDALKAQMEQMNLKKQ